MFNNISKSIISKEISVSTINNIIIAGFSFFLNIKIANELEPDVYGQYHYLISIASIFTILINFGTDKIASYDFLNFNNLQKVFNYVISIRFAFALLTLIITLIFFNSSLFFLAIIAMNLGCFNLSFIYEIKVKNGLFSKIFLIEKIIYILIIVLSIFFNFLSIYFIFWSIIISSLISLVIQLSFCKDLIKNFKINLFDVFTKPALSNLYVTLIFFSEYAYGGISKIFIQDKIDFESLGIFSAGMQIILIVSIFQSQIEKVLRPVIYESQRTNKYFFIKSIKKYFLFSTFPVIIFSIVFYYFSPFFIELFFSSKYLGVLEIIFELSIYAILINIKSFMGIIYVGFNKIFRFMVVSVFFSFCLLISFYFSPSNLSLGSYFFIIIFFQLINYIFLSFDIYFLTKKKFKK